MLCRLKIGRARQNKYLLNMCGIFCLLSTSSEYDYTLFQEIFSKCKENLQRRGPDYNSVKETNLNNWNFFLSSSVLWLQGNKLTAQPVEDERFLFLYNGDIFGENPLSSDSRSINGDTALLLNLIKDSDSILNSLSSVTGPYAFILIDKVKLKLYFGRDTYGRRSLLIGRENNKLLLTSVASKNINFTMMELPALGLYCLDLNVVNDLKLTLMPWIKSNQHFENKYHELQSFLKLPLNFNVPVNYFETLCDPSEESISVLNNLESLSNKDIFSFLQNTEIWNRNILTIKDLLQNAVHQRIKNQPKYCNNCIQTQFECCDHCSIGVLFSGGIDCAIIALLADECVESTRQIDLINVAFEKEKNNYNTPDRLTALQTLEELQMLRPNRRWNLLEINITQDELNIERERRIGDLIYPLNTILDDSLGCALWFAARGKTDSYISSCRVLLVGMGADELFGGYTRHRGAYKRGKWQELAKELDYDWRNISHRNLARDDRVISDHGRQVRTPYLDEDFVEFVRKIPAWERCYPTENLPQGIGDKLLLRSLAYHLGLTQAAILRKRALQFGSRIANSKENAHEISPRLLPSNESNIMEK